MWLKDKKVLLGVTGSISAYKACDLVQRLKDEGATVRVIMTHSATKLVHPNTFAALTGYKVSVDTFAGTESGAMEHIDLARWADIYLVAPCTGHTMGEFSQGLTGSLLSLVYMVYSRKTYIAPAMNSVMLASAAVTRNLNLLSAKGDVILPTGEGILACGEIGYGKLLDVAQIITYLNTDLAQTKKYPNLIGKKILISLGHTRERWDDIRFISNRSSGKTGLAIARMLHLSGAEVTLVVGVIDESLPSGFTTVRVETSAEFHREMLSLQPGMDVVIMAAAIADFVPAEIFSGKKKASRKEENIALKPFPNILQELGNQKTKGQLLVGFALETHEAIFYGETKMHDRNCDLMVVNNPVDDQSGFGKNRVLATLLIRNSGAQTSNALAPSLKEMDKNQLADLLLSNLDILFGK